MGPAPSGRKRAGRKRERSGPRRPSAAAVSSGFAATARPRGATAEGPLRANGPTQIAEAGARLTGPDFRGGDRESAFGGEGAPPGGGGGGRESWRSRRGAEEEPVRGRGWRPTEASDVRDFPHVPHLATGSGPAAEARQPWASVLRVTSARPRRAGRQPGSCRRRGCLTTVTARPATRRSAPSASPSTPPTKPGPPQTREPRGSRLGASCKHTGRSSEEAPSRRGLRVRPRATATCS